MKIEQPKPSGRSVHRVVSLPAILSHAEDSPTKQLLSVFNSVLMEMLPTFLESVGESSRAEVSLTTLYDPSLNRTSIAIVGMEGSSILRSSSIAMESLQG